MLFPTSIDQFRHQRAVILDGFPSGSTRTFPFSCEEINKAFWWKDILDSIQDAAEALSETLILDVGDRTIVVVQC